MAEAGLTAEQLKAIDYQSRRYFRRRAFKDGFNLAGIATSALSITFLLLDVTRFNVADVFRSVYDTFKAIAHSLYFLAFSWMDLDVPPWGPAAFTVYCVLGMTAARTAMIYLGDGTAATRADGGFRLWSNHYMGFLHNVVRWTGPLRAFFIVPLVAPIWPYTFLSSHESIAFVRGEIISTNYRRMFMPILGATLLGTFVLTVTNAALGAYSPEKVVERGQVSQTARTTTSVNLRLGPSSRTEAISVLAPGTPVKVLERRDDGWLEVEWNGRRGFVHGAYIEHGKIE